MTSALTNQRQVFKLCLTQTERVSDDVTRKIGLLDFTGLTYTVNKMLMHLHIIKNANQNERKKKPGKLIGFFVAINS